MKKLTAMLLTLCFSVALVGCEETKTTTKSKTDASGTKTTTTTTEKTK